ncbi:MAG: YkgJ family cysteine cluster protein [Nitrospirae bacterium]|nr:YkgJ family cysteine cluster protein [Nitrospirota bacterium]
MNKEYTEKQRRLFLNDKFNFSCHKGLTCFNRCCSDINIFLTPYDVLRMRKATWLSSEEFLKSYTVALSGDEGLPLVVLKMIEDENKTCPFVTPDGCGIYQDRPWSCRMYPIFPVSFKEEGFLIKEDSSCLGFKEEKQWTVQEWKKDQGIDIYDKMNESYKEITFHDYFQKGNKLDSGRTKMLYNACYNLYDFKRFLFETRFFDIYDVDKEVVEKIKEDEEELLNFGYRWVRFNLFSEDTLKLKDKALDKLLQARKEESGLKT